MINNHFTSDGLHKEHSSEYHIYMANFLSTLVQSNYINNSDINSDTNNDSNNDSDNDVELQRVLEISRNEYFSCSNLNIISDFPELGNPV